MTLPELKKSAEGNSFTEEQLTRIFSGSIYRAFIDDKEARFTPNHPLKPHVFWAPLIALFQGLREGEILQFHTEDFSQKDDVWCIHVHRLDEHEVKRDASVRFIPIHPELIKMGLLRYVQAVRDAGLRELFPEATKGKTYGNASHNYSKRFSRYLVEVGVKEGRNTVFHSFRHTYADGLRIAGVPEDIRQRLGGWSGGRKSVESHYGGRLMPLLAKHLATLKYDGLDLSALEIEGEMAPARMLPAKRTETALQSFKMRVEGGEACPLRFDQQRDALSFSRKGANIEHEPINFHGLPFPAFPKRSTDAAAQEAPECGALHVPSRLSSESGLVPPLRSRARQCATGRNRGDDGEASKLGIPQRDDDQERPLHGVCPSRRAKID